MIKIIIPLVFTFFIGLVNAQQLEWAVVTGNSATEISESIIVDNLGNTYSTGYFGGTVDFDPGPGVFQLTALATKNAFILKLNPAGEFIWAKAINSDDDVWAHTIVVGGSIGDEIYIGGTFKGTADFDPGPGQNDITSLGFTDGFILKLNDNGDFQWVKAYGSAGNEGVYSLKVNDLNQLYATGEFANTIDFNPTGGPLDLVSNGASDVFCSKYDINGDILWAKGFGSPFDDKGTSIAYDSEYNVIVSGQFQGTADFDPSVANFDMISNGGIDVFVSKLAHDGDWIWAKNIGGPSAENNPKIEVSTNPDNKIYISGSYQGTADFDPSGAVNNITSAGAHDIYAVILDELGNLSLVQSFGGTGEDYSRGIDLSSTDDIYITGDYKATVDFDNSDGTYELTSAGQNDAFVLKLNQTLSVNWAKSIEGTSRQEAKSIYVDNSDNVYVSGYVQGTTDFDPFSGVTALTAIGSYDAFTMKLTPCTPVLYSDGHSACGSYTWTNGIEYFLDNNSATQVLESASGCDSIVTLNLEIYALPTVSAGADISTCLGQNTTLSGSGAVSYTWDGIDDGLTPIDGNGFIKPLAGSYSYEVTGTASNGCTNVDTLVVSIIPLPTFTVVTTNTTCNGISDGIITINGLSSTTTYQLEYTGSSSGYTNAGSITTNGSGEIILIGLNAEVFTNFIVTSQSSGCQGTVTGPYTITEPTSISVLQETDITQCESSGQITINGSASGGTGVYTFVFDNGITDGTAFTPPIGTTTYNLSVIDENNCTGAGIFQVVNIEATPTFTISPTNPTTCSGTDGSITLTGLTANSNYDVNYQKDNGVTSVGPISMTANLSGELIISGLEANIYDDFTVTSVLGCIGNDATSIITLTDPTPPSVDAGVDQTICDGDQVTLMAVSGTGSSITWDNGVQDGVAFTPTATTTYAASVSDNGCTITDSIEVIVTPLDDASFNYSAISYCLNDVNQLPTVMTPGGTFSGIASINPTTGEIDLATTTQGPNTITYTTNGTCPTSSTETIEFYTPPIVSTVDATFCLNNGDFDLSTLSTPIGGTFSGQYIQNNIFITDLALAQNYSYDYSYTDVNGCSANDLGTLIINPIPEISLSVINTTCGNSTGSVDATITNGTAPYSIIWSTGETTEDLTAVQSNNYYITVTDNNLCYAMDVATVSNTEIALSGTVTDNLCHGNQNGSINLTVTGTTGPYLFYWSNGETTEDISNLTAGQYEVFVTDNSNCTSTLSFIVEQPNLLNVAFNNTNPTSCGTMDGSILSTVTGGSPIYTYEWLDNTNATIATNQNLLAVGGGIYTLNVEDDNGCTVSNTTVITDDGGPTVVLNQNTSASCSNDGTLNIDVNSTVAIQSYLWSNGEITEDITNLSPNNYAVTVTDINNCQTHFSTIVSPLIPAPTDICLVTVDTATNTNLVVWEKLITTDIDYYVIFRETSVANEFLPVDTIDYADLSQFTDPIAYPQFRSWRYKIKSVNTCGYSSDFGDIHKTIHVTISTGLAGAYNLNWDQYEGFTYPTFDIWRHTDTDGWGTNPIQSVPSNQFSFTDTPPTINGLDYIIEITPPNVCSSTTTKAIDHNSSRSNKAKNVTAPGSGNSNSIAEKHIKLNIEIYPNPSKSIFNIVLNNDSNKSLKLYDMRGSIIKEFNTSSTTLQIDLNQYENGMYILEVFSNNSVIRKQLLKQ